MAVLSLERFPAIESPVSHVSPVLALWIIAVITEYKGYTHWMYSTLPFHILYFVYSWNNVSGYTILESGFFFFLSLLPLMITWAPPHRSFCFALSADVR